MSPRGRPTRSRLSAAPPPSDQVLGTQLHRGLGWLHHLVRDVELARGMRDRRGMRERRRVSTDGVFGGLVCAKMSREKPRRR